MVVPYPNRGQNIDFEKYLEFITLSSCGLTTLAENACGMIFSQHMNQIAVASIPLEEEL